MLAAMRRAALGVEIQPVTPDIASALGLKRIEGALVAETQPDGPAAKAGIVPGDVVIAVEAQSIRNGADLAAKIGSMAPGTAAAIRILRDGSERTVSVTLGELPVTPFKVAAAPQQQEPSTLGLTLAPYPAPKRRLPNRSGQGHELDAVVPGLDAHQDVVLAALLRSTDRVLDISRRPDWVA